MKGLIQNEGETGSAGRTPVAFVPEANAEIMAPQVGKQGFQKIDADGRRILPARRFRQKTMLHPGG